MSTPQEVLELSEQALDTFFKHHNIEVCTLDYSLQNEYVKDASHGPWDFSYGNHTLNASNAEISLSYDINSQGFSFVPVLFNWFYN